MLRLTRWLLVAGTIGGGALASAGCADNNSALFVRAVLVVEAPNCVAKPDPTSLFRTAGVMDLQFRDTYSAVLLVGNQHVRRGSKDLLRTETSRVTLQGAEVEVLNDQEEVITEFTVPGSGFVDPGTGDEPGYGLMGTQLLPPNLGLSAGTRVTVNVRVFGETLGGSEVESFPLTFPIAICNGCLISYPIDADDPAQPGYQCVNSESAAEVEEPCAFGQDDLIDCRLCGSNPLCVTPP